MKKKNKKVQLIVVCILIVLLLLLSVCLAIYAAGDNETDQTGLFPVEAVREKIL